MHQLDFRDRYSVQMHTGLKLGFGAVLRFLLVPLLLILGACGLHGDRVWSFFRLCLVRRMLEGYNLPGEQEGQNLDDTGGDISAHP